MKQVLSREQMRMEGVWGRNLAWMMRWVFFCMTSRELGAFLKDDLERNWWLYNCVIIKTRIYEYRYMSNTLHT